LSRTPQPGTAVYVRARFKDVPDDFWARANVTAGSRAEITIPTDRLSDLTTLLGVDTLDAVFNVEEFESRVSMSNQRSALVGRTSSATSEPGCPSFSSAANPPHHYTPCTGGVLRLLEPGRSGPSRRIGIVLVHGWHLQIANGEDYLKAQGIVCTRTPSISSLLSVVCSAPSTPDPNAVLPVTSYFKSLLAALRADQLITLQGAPIYGFDYQSYRSVEETGTQFWEHLNVAMTRDSLDGYVLVGHSMGGLVARVAARLFEGSSVATQAILGVITLATPHLGSPLASAKVPLVSGVFTPGISTAGGDDLAKPWPRYEQVALTAYGGVLDYEPFRGVWGYAWTGNVLCVLYDYCQNDGVVPVSSALPSSFLGGGRVELRTPYAGYNHTQMKAGRGTSAELNRDALYVGLKGDLSRLLRSSGSSSRIYASSGMSGPLGPSNLWSVDPTAGGRDTYISPIREAGGRQPLITDVAVSPEGSVWGTSFDQLYRIDTATGIATTVGRFTGAMVNSFTFDSVGNFYFATTSGLLFGVGRDRMETFVSRSLGSAAAGDIAFGPDGRLFAVLNTNAGNRLAEINLATGATTLIGQAPLSANVWGIVFVGRELFGLTFGTGTQNGQLLQIDPATGASVSLRTLQFKATGAGAPPAPN